MSTGTFYFMTSKVSHVGSDPVILILIPYFVAYTDLN